MEPRDDIEAIAEQERVLQFTGFDAEVAWRLGCALRERLLRTEPGGTVEIEAGGLLLFACATRSAKPDHADWIRRKRNTVRRLGRSSFGVGRELALEGATLASRFGLSEVDFAAHGGGFPLVIRGQGLVGTVVVSGLPQREDHRLVVETLADVLGVNVVAV